MQLLSKLFVESNSQEFLEMISWTTLNILLYNGSPMEKCTVVIPSSSISYQITLIYMCPFPPRPFRDRWGVACTKHWVSKLLHAFTPTLKETKTYKNVGSLFCGSLKPSQQTPSNSYGWRDEFLLLYSVQLGNLPRQQGVKPGWDFS